DLEVALGRDVPAQVLDRLEQHRLAAVGVLGAERVVQAGQPAGDLGRQDDGHHHTGDRDQTEQAAQDAAAACGRGRFGLLAGTRWALDGQAAARVVVGPAGATVDLGQFCCGMRVSVRDACPAGGVSVVVTAGHRLLPLREEYTPLIPTVRRGANGRESRGYVKADRPVSCWPMTSWCISDVPSYVRTVSRFDA